MKDLTAADILTTPVLTVAEDWPLDRVARFLVDNAVTGVPVTGESGKAVGVVSMTDIVRHGSLPARADEPDDAHEYYFSVPGCAYTDQDLRGFRVEAADETAIRDVMTPMLFEVSERASVQDIADMMVRGRIHRVLVTADKKLVGIVSALDVLKAVRDL